VNPYIIAIGIASGMIPLVARHLLPSSAEGSRPLHFGSLLASSAAVVLDLYFRGREVGSRARARSDIRRFAC